MTKSNWHLRIALTSTAALMSLATALIIPQLSSSRYDIPEMAVPYHATAPQSSIEAACAEVANRGMGHVLGVVDSDVPVHIEIYSRDTAAQPENSLEWVDRENCVHLSSVIDPRKVSIDLTRDTLTKFVCNKADTVAYNAQ